ncbi:MAG: hypothetical protein WAW03_18395 [Anaerolineae bacterium]
MNNFARAAGDLALARRNYEQAVSLYDRLGHRREAAQARNNLGGVLFRQYEIEAADAVWSDALAVLESVGDMVTAADVRRNLELITEVRETSDESDAEAASVEEIDQEENDANT